MRRQNKHKVIPCPLEETRKWSAGVMKRSNALNLEQGIFTGSPSRIE